MSPPPFAAGTSTVYSFSQPTLKMLPDLMLLVCVCMYSHAPAYTPTLTLSLSLSAL